MSGTPEQNEGSRPSTSYRVTNISCGSSHTVALLSCDLVVSFGRGEDGQLGHGDADERLTPQAIAKLSHQGVSAVVCGAEYTIAVCRQAQQVFSWGWGDFGRLGHGDATDVFIPRPIAAFAGKPITKVACGDTHTLAVTESGELYAFGRNQNGQLGLGTTADSLAPQLVTALQGRRVMSVAAGAEHSVAAVEGGRVLAWGWGRYGNLGDGQRCDRLVPTPCAGLEGVHISAVACGWRHSLAVDEAQGAIYTFGWSKYGQLGHGDFSDQLVPLRVEALRSARIKLVAGGWRHTAAADTAGALYAWGWNKFGQLGNGGTADAATPQSVAGGLAGQAVAQLACGWRHTVAVTADGQVFSWGRGVNGQLGHGDMADLSLPARVAALSAGSVDVNALAAPAPGPSAAYIPPSDRYAVVPDPGTQRGKHTPNGTVAGGPAGDDSCVPDTHPESKRRKH